MSCRENGAMNAILMILAVLLFSGCSTTGDSADLMDIVAHEVIRPPEGEEVTAMEVPDTPLSEDIRDVRVKPDLCEMTPVLPWFGERLCGMDTGEMEFWGLCPFKDFSSVPLGERLIFGGDPSRKWGLPAGAQCPAGFECLPPVNPAFAEVCDFQPTAFGVLPILVYEPITYNGQYLMAGADQGKNADPSAILALNPRMFYPLLDHPVLGCCWEPTLYGFNFFPPCPAEHLTVPIEEARSMWDEINRRFVEHFGGPPLNAEPRFPPCTSKEPWQNPSPREMLSQWGPFVQYVVFPSFKGVKKCNIAVKTYACGPVLMFTGEDFEAVMSLDETELCKGADMDYSTGKIAKTIVSKGMKDAGLDGLGAIYDWCKVDGDSCRDAAVCEYCYGAPCGLHESVRLCWPHDDGPMEPFCTEDEEVGNGVPRPGSFPLFPVPGYIMRWDPTKQDWDFAWTICTCDPSGEGKVASCGVSAPAEDFLPFISPSKQFERIPEFLEGCSDRLLSPPMTL